MKVLILGSGVLGITSAWYLAKAGYEVTVLDRQPGPGLETSFGNAGMISPGYSAPWAAPGVPLKAIKWLMSEHAPLAIRPTSDPQQYRWMMQMLSNCTQGRYAVNKERMMRLAEYSRDCLIQLRADSGLDYEHRELGTLQLFRTQKQLDAAANDIAVLQRCGVPYQLLDRAGCIQHEPGLAPSSDKFVGGLRLPNDETGDCYMFTTQLAAKCAELGVNFLFNRTISSLLSHDNRIQGVSLTDGEVLTADQYVLALGSYSPQLVKPLGISLPIYPVKGYSLTIPVADPSMAPVSTIMDETYKVAITRFANRIRVGGMAELAGFDTELREKRRATLKMVINDLFPLGGQAQELDFWTGYRPMTPDGTPIIGTSKLSNLFFNTGHGTLGWTMACGSSQLLVDRIAGSSMGISITGFELDRYAKQQ